ncbi:MAG TPA: hypothetical protein PKE16_03590, partial [Hyphomicrobium sp.]|nr:hypothetical protein [Hyphomicrobium sp.]
PGVRRAKRWRLSVPMMLPSSAESMRGFRTSIAEFSASLLAPPQRGEVRGGENIDAQILKFIGYFRSHP